jgi:hypothetical protein
MPDLPERQLPRLDAAQGTRLDIDAYNDDFWKRYQQLHGRHSWKLERGQHFVEQNHPSREALARGDWNEALRLLDDRRDALRKEREVDEQLGTVFHRVRVVERPFTPYVQWELHSLMMNAQHAGEAIRIIDATELASLENDAPLPEVVVLGGETLYRVLYTDEGVLDGGIRFTDPTLVGHWEAAIRELFEAGEDIATYVEREVAPLPAPRLTRE